MQQERDTIITTDLELKIAKHLVSVYTKHIDKRVKDLDIDYISLGVDATFKQYKALFNLVVTRLLGVPTDVSIELAKLGVTIYPTGVVMECINILLDEIQKYGWEKYLDKHDKASGVLAVCFYLLDKVKEEKFPCESGGQSVEVKTSTLLN